MVGRHGATSALGNGTNGSAMPHSRATRSVDEDEEIKALTMVLWPSPCPAPRSPWTQVQLPMSTSNLFTNFTSFVTSVCYFHADHRARAACKSALPLLPVTEEDLRESLNTQKTTTYRKQAATVEYAAGNGKRKWSFSLHPKRRTNFSQTVPSAPH